MVQIIESNKRPSFGQKFSNAVGAGLQGANQLYQQHQGQLQQQQAAKTAKEQFGLDISGFDPETQKALLVEAFKQQGQQGILGQKQEFLNKLFGNVGQQPDQDQQQQNKQFDPSQLSDAQIAQVTAMDPNVGRALSHAKDVALRDKRSQEELEFKKMKESPEHRRETQLESSQAQADVKYNQTLQEASKQHELKEQTLDRLEALNKKGVTGRPYEKLLEKMGLVNLTSEGRREFSADVKNLITDIRSILGGQFSAFEFQTILNAYPSADFSKGANEAIIKNLKDFQDIKKKEVEFAQEIKKQNKGKIPFDFQALVNEKVREYAATKLPEIKANAQKIMNEEYGIKPGFTLMFDPQGNPLNVPENEVAKFAELGATLP